MIIAIRVMTEIARLLRLLVSPGLREDSPRMGVAKEITLPLQTCSKGKLINHLPQHLFATTVEFRAICLVLEQFAKVVFTHRLGKVC